MYLKESRFQLHIILLFCVFVNYYALYFCFVFLICCWKAIFLPKYDLRVYFIYIILYFTLSKYTQWKQKQIMDD